MRSNKSNILDKGKLIPKDDQNSKGNIQRIKCIWLSIQKDHFLNGDTRWFILNDVCRRQIKGWKFSSFDSFAGISFVKAYRWGLPRDSLPLLYSNEEFVFPVERYKYVCLLEK